MVGSLSGSMEEVFAAKETIRKWNLENAKRTGKLYMLTDWSVKDDQLQDLDVVVGVVGNWAKNTSLIEDCIKDGKIVLLFFNAFQDPMNTIASEQDAVMAFRNKMQPHCICELYNSIIELNSKLKERLVFI